jgi:hypothetical protein
MDRPVVPVDDGAISSTSNVEPELSVSPIQKNSRAFHWRPALEQASAFLAVQHAVDSRYYQGTLKGPFFRDWFRSVGRSRWGHWDDGDSLVTNNLGHPFMGATAAFIQIQNDPAAPRPRGAFDKSYWKSRARATMFSAAYALQWEIGPVSEASIGNVGSHDFVSRRTGKLTNGTGMTDLVMTPVGGLLWVLAEDALDRHVIARLDGPNHHGAYRAMVSLLNPARSTANLLRGKAPWYRGRE